MTVTRHATMNRENLNHPIIDSDGHFWEFTPVFFDYLKSIGGPGIVEEFEKSVKAARGVKGGWYNLSPSERLDYRVTRPSWWIPPGRATDLATVMVPRLLSERLPELGIDFSVLYPSIALRANDYDSEDLRRAACRAFNNLHSDIFSGYSARMTPAAVIPMHTPREAIEELEHAVLVLGMKVVLLPSFVKRPIPAIAREHPGAAAFCYWLDTYAMDSDHDYDCVWAKCVELKVAPSFHTGTMGTHTRASISNYMYNHIGHFAAGGEAICKSLFMGGVTRRFPTLKFAFLEGGVGWACSLYNDLVGHWKKRNRSSVLNYDPSNIDRSELKALFAEYGDARVRQKLKQEGDIVPIVRRENPESYDEWASCGIDRPEDIRDLYSRNFYFGCEGDDPINAWAFDSSRLPFDSRLKAIYGSDIGHWDVPDINGVAQEARELVERGLLTDSDFRDFVFSNPVSLWAGSNPDFFQGTSIEGDVARVLG